jgi:hypothetical protein
LDKELSQMLRGTAGLVCGLAWAFAHAEPLVEPAQRASLVQPASETADESPIDVQGWIQRETALEMLDGSTQADRVALLRQGWKDRPPTWIQDAVVVNLGDFPALDNSTERAERDLKTLEWVLEEQRRQAEGRPTRESDAINAAPQDNWLRNLLPRQWIATLKANREWVVAGGVTLLLVVWGTTIFSRRPSPSPVETPARQAPDRRHRRRRRDDRLRRTAG